ncbi:MULTISPECIES: hypothetical protein [unclassified Bradyrhizobium]|uniref:hypothetical protein n=1 Tax=unclassified Bradyrhizobium TaxID=2631580 RepID=UPI001CD5DD56|nr:MULTISPECIES: hypothetical protein [unclassified Bradyrhizobium]MCA1382716.1 hypothetical protein [Bradyrhizobium sp. BRP05]MCA1421822.1 hypothetical protein [Bradyrhizobium sp. BRP23]MCA1434681.1 hypothetical protein [Bradyrhizobium sp. BRP20]MCA1549757.1 hypothetical protein [Bradyrhizobium sp. BRP19]
MVIRTIQATTYGGVRPVYVTLPRVEQLIAEHPEKYLHAPPPFENRDYRRMGAGTHGPSTQTMARLTVAP